MGRNSAIAKFCFELDVLKRILVFYFKVIVPGSPNHPTQPTMAAYQNEGINRMIQSDWGNREYIEIITGSIKKISDFLNSFGIFSISTLMFYLIISIVILDRSCRGRLALLNEKLTNLERSIEILEAKVFVILRLHNFPNPYFFVLQVSKGEISNVNALNQANSTAALSNMPNQSK